MNRRRLLASAPVPIVGPPPSPRQHQERREPPPCYEREGSPQIDAVGPDMERRNVAALADSLGFQERDAALRRLHPGPRDWGAVAARAAAYYETATAIGRRRAAAARKAKP